MAKATFKAITNGKVLSQGDVVVFDDVRYIFRGVSKDGKGIRVTLKGRSSEWSTIMVDDVNNLEIRSVKDLESKVEAPKVEASKPTERKGYSKQRAQDALSERIRVESGICSYKMDGIHLTDNKDGTVTQHGGFTAHGHARKSQTYSNAEIKTSKGGCIIIDCINCTGDKVRFIHDPLTQETYLFVKVLGGVRKVF